MLDKATLLHINCDTLECYPKFNFDVNQKYSIVVGVFQGGDFKSFCHFSSEINISKRVCRLISITALFH
jgi:hypothetical protein